MRTRETCVAVKEVRRAGVRPLCHQSPLTSIARRVDGYEHKFGCSYLSCSSLPAMDDLRLPALLSIHLPTSLCSSLVRRFSAHMEAQSPVCLSLAQLRGSPIHHT